MTEEPANRKNEIILYQPDNAIQLEVKIEDDTVWLTQAQMVILFARERTVITKHINNIFQEGELDEKSNVHFLHIPNSDKPVKIYSLDVIISVGYRIKSQRGTEFRIWATKTLKEYLLRGYAIKQRFDQIDNRLMQHEQKLWEQQKQIDFIVRTELPPKEGIFFDGQIFDAYKFVSDLVERAKQRVVVIDNYLGTSVFALLSKRGKSVSATIYTGEISAALKLDLTRHNAQYPKIVIEKKLNIHDRFLIIDNDLYHIGASLKDLGKKLFAFSKMEMNANELLQLI